MRQPLLAPAILIILFVGTLVLGWWVDRAAPPRFNVARFEFVGDADRAGTMLAKPCKEAEPKARERCEVDVQRRLRSSTWRDFPFIVVYAALFAWAGMYGRRIVRTTFAQRAVSLVGLAGVFAALCDIAENVFLLRLLHRAGGRFDRLSEAKYMTAATIPKWTLIVVAGLIGVTVLWTTITRSLRRWRRLPRFGPRPTSSPLYDEQHPWCWPGGWSRYDWNYRAYPRRNAAAEPPVGVCFSGGGIRSASFASGALHVLETTKVPRTRTPILRRVDYLATVSGGGYLGGAAQILGHQEVENPFTEGSAEEDHLRRHGRYLADSAGEWGAAAARLIAGLVLNLLVIVLLLFAFGRPIGWLQRDVLFEQPPPTTTTTVLQARADSGEEIDQKKPLRGLKTTDAMWSAAAWPAALALVVLLFGTAGGGIDSTRRDRLLVVAGGLGALAVAVLGLVWLLPFIARMTPDVVGRIGKALPGRSDQGTAGSITILTALTAGGGTTLISVLRSASARSTPDSSKRFDWRKFLDYLAKAAPYITGAVLAVAALAVFSMIVSGGAAPAGFEWPLDIPDRCVWYSAIAALLALYTFADQTRWSLHPFYRRRLATAFAIQRTSDGRARELPWSVPTTLSKFGRRAEAAGLPQLIVCAAANVQGQSIAPAGRRAVSFVFTDSYVGGPQVGWARTEDFETVLGGVQKNDATLMGAVAISGAAFASAMGRHSKGSLNALFAVTNARLGVWLPSPRYLAELRGVENVDAVDGWRGPWVRRRRFTYLLKEIAGMYSDEDRYLYLTDGGHYENLGLVELMRRRCRTIICFDAAGDSLETCGTFVEALALAREELGITVDIDIEAIAPRPKKSDERPATEADIDVGVLRLLGGRLSEDCVARGDIFYPATREHEAAEGTLILAKAALTEDAPLEVLDHAAREAKPKFPNDPTGDQWFDVDQFNAYRLLGEFVAEKACARLRAADF